MDKGRKRINRKKYTVIGGLIVILLAIITGFSIYNMPANRLARQLDLGQRYLEELNYEQAVVAFNVAIEIDPRSADAYLGLADAYIGLGDEEAAYAALEKGYEATGDARIKERMDEMVQEKEVEAEQADSVNSTDNPVDDTRLMEIIDLAYRQIGAANYDLPVPESIILLNSGTEHLLTYEQIEMAYRPLTQELETWLEAQEEGGTGSSFSDSVWHALSAIYLHLGDMEQCLETRRIGYGITGWDVLKPESTEQRDEYGRIKEADGSITYGEADRETLCEPANGEDKIPVSSLEYDDLGRIARATQTYADGTSYIQEYEYKGDYMVVITGCWSNDTPSFATLSYDEYGRFLNELEWRHEEDGGNINVE